MSTFNLNFSGEILSGRKPDAVKRRFAKAFDIDDPQRLERFFSGETITLRRNLDRKAAAQCYQEMRAIGIVVELVKASSQDVRRTVADTATRQRERAAADELVRLEAERAAQRERVAARREREKAAQERENAERERRKTAQAIHNAEREAERLAQRARDKARRESDKARREAKKQAERERAQAERERQKIERAAAQAENARRQAEQLARERAREAAAKRDAARKQARLEAEAAARAEAAAAEEAARRAALEKIKAEDARQRAAEEARQQAKKAERKAAAQARRAKKAQQRETAQQAQREAEQHAREEEKQRKKKQAQETARQRVWQELQQRREQQEQEKQRQLLEEQAISRGAAELARGASIKTAQPRLKTRLDVPQGDATQRSTTTGPAPRRRQEGEPNFYTLKAFRVNEEVRQRPARAARHRRNALALFTLSLLVCAAALFLRLQWPPPSPVTGVDGLAVNSAGELFMLARGQLLRHDRAGVGEERIDTAAYHISAPQPPLQFAPDDALLLIAKPAAADGDTRDSPPQLLRCEPGDGQCNALTRSDQPLQISDFMPHPLDGSLFLADAQAQTLLRLDAQGNVLGRAQLILPQRPSMYLHAGLIFIASANGPAISVHRYDRDAFAAQLDEILLLPDPAVQAQQTRVADFLRAGNNWWVALCNDAEGNCGLYRFDDQWNYLNQVPLEDPRPPLHLVAWGDRVLVNGGRELQIARYNLEGVAGAPLQSSLLTALAEQGEQASRIRRLALNGGFALALLLALCAGSLTYLNSLRLLVYQSTHDRGAQPVDDFADSLVWVPPAAQRQSVFKQRLGTAIALAAAGFLLCIGLGASATQLGALLLALSGPQFGVLILQRLPIGHIGTTGDHLLLVDHNDLYHFGRGSEIQYRGSFLILYDVVVFCGNRFAPAFSRTKLNAQVTPLARNGVKIDRKTLLIKLVQSRHPIVQALGAVIVCTGLALLVLCSPLLV